MQKIDYLLPVGWGRQKEVGQWKYELLGVREFEGCIVQHKEYSQYSAKTVNGN